MSGVGAIGVFDSGVGGLSVVQALRRQLPAESLLYFADSGHCPYGGQSASAIRERAVVITDALLASACKLVVVACNTATIAAVEHLRATYPVPFVGMEPAVKPAAAVTRSGVIGVLATGAALAGDKFHRLLATHARDLRVITQPCPGLVECVEAGDLDGPEPERLLRRYLEPLLEQGVDTVVLGCTHYPFLRPLIRHIVGREVHLLDTGPAVARQVGRLLQREGLSESGSSGSFGSFGWLTSGDPETVGQVIDRLMTLDLDAQAA